MIEYKPELEPRASKGLEWTQFFESYSKVQAFTKKMKKPNEAISLFNQAKSQLEDRLGASDDGESAILQALLALVYWLYPDQLGYDRQKVASMMLKHSNLALQKSDPGTPSNAFGLFIQLRVLPFLVRSKKVPQEGIARRRQDAESLIELYYSGKAREGHFDSSPRGEIELFRGMIYDCLAFSHYQLERDNQKALSMLDASIRSLNEARKIFRQRELGQKNQALLKIKRSICDSIAAVASWDCGLCYESIAENLEGEAKLSNWRLAREQYERSYRFASRSSWEIYRGLAAYSIAGATVAESETVSEPRVVHRLLKRSVSIGEEALKCMARWSTFESDFLGGSMIAGFYERLAEHSSHSEKKKYIARSLELSRKAVALLEKLGPKSARYSQAHIGDIFLGNASLYHRTASERRKASKLDDEAIIELLKKSLEYCLKSRTFYGTEERYNKRQVDACLLSAQNCYELMNCDILSSERKKMSSLGTRICREANDTSAKMEWKEKIGESSWLSAQILDREGEYEKSSGNYMLACKAYVQAGGASERAMKLFEDYASYMLGLSKIELAKIAHRKSEYEEASRCYSQAANLVSSSKRWHGLSSLFLAESLIERAESESMKDKPLTSVELFDEAIIELSKFLSHSKLELSEDSSEQIFARELVAFSRARIMLEKSKDSYLTGDIEQSIKRLASAGTMFQELSSSPTSDSLRSNELGSMASLCEALKSFQSAQLGENPRLYLEAKEIFGAAAKTSTSKSLKPLLLGLAGFASFLYHSSEIEKSLDTSFSADRLAECNRALESSESIFRRTGNKSFLRMLKASRHILNATIKMSAAEREVERVSERSRLYSEAQRSLSLASKYYKLLGYSNRVKEAIRMISAVRTHQRLIPLAHDIIAEVASNQIIYSAIANSTLVERSTFDSSMMRDVAYVTLECALEKPYLTSGESSNLTFSLSNLGRESISIVKIDEALPEEFEIEPCGLSLEGNSLKLNFKLEQGATRQIRLKYVTNTAGDYVWHPSLIYIDSSKSYRIARVAPIRSVVESSAANDFKVLLLEKERLEKELESLKVVDSQEEKIYSLKERISKIDEVFLKTKNEYELLQQDLSRVESDIAALIAKTSGAGEENELEKEKELLVAKINRRRSLLEQARLL